MIRNRQGEGEEKVPKSEVSAVTVEKCVYWLAWVLAGVTWTTFQGCQTYLVRFCDVLKWYIPTVLLKSLGK